MIQGKKTTRGLAIRKVVDLNVLQRIQDSFSEAMGFAAMIVDRNGVPVTRGSSFVRLCRTIRSTETGLARCSGCDREGGLEAQSRQVPVIYTCKGGLIDIAAPIMMEGEYLCSIHCGQVIPADSREEHFEEVIRRNENLRLTKSEMTQIVQEIPVIQRKRIHAAAEMLFVLANYIVEMGVANLNQAQLLEETHTRAVMAETMQKEPINLNSAHVHPNFLINTLGLIGYMAIREKAYQTEDMVYCLTDLLQYNFRNTAHPVPLARDVELIERYLHLQKVRFGDRLNLIMEIDSDLLHVQIPCLILQPIVHNVIVHTVEAVMHPVTIRISAKLTTGGMQLEVSDDCPGIDVGLSSGVNSESFIPPSNRTSLSLQNVFQRLELEYKEALTVEMNSTSGSGMRVRVTVPINR